MMPSFMSCLMTSEAVFFRRIASSPTAISSGIMTFRVCFFSISCRSFFMRSASSCRFLADMAGFLSVFFFVIFCLEESEPATLSGTNFSMRSS